MKLSQAMGIMANFKKNGHIDPDLFNVFVKKGVYRRYAEQYLDPVQMDAVDEEALLIG
jgi:HD-GYP domain-containing protein (c-di-GMP phosphodiesterase class II)